MIQRAGQGLPVPALESNLVRTPSNPVFERTNLMPDVQELRINGKTVKVDADRERHLLGVLRDDLGLTGAKYGCGEGRCGACTVLIDGTPTRSCITRLGAVAAREITTIEALEKDGKLHPLQQAFLDAGAMQCALLYRRNDHDRARTPPREPQPDAPGDRRVHGWEYLPVWDLSADHRRPPQGRADARRRRADERPHRMIRDRGRDRHRARALRVLRRAGLPLRAGSPRLPQGDRRRPPGPLPAGSRRRRRRGPTPRRSAAWGRRTGGQSGPQDLGAWLHIGEDGRISVYTGKAEVGQNIRTSLAQAVAEELRTPVASIHMVMADTKLTPYDMGTFGSMTTPVWRRSSVARPPPPARCSSISPPRPGRSTAPP